MRDDDWDVGDWEFSDMDEDLDDDDAPITPTRQRTSIKLAAYGAIAILVIGGAATYGGYIIGRSANGPGTSHQVTIVELDARCADGSPASAAMGVRLSEHSIWWTDLDGSMVGTRGTLHIDQSESASFRAADGRELPLERASSLPLAASCLLTG